MPGVKMVEVTAYQFCAFMQFSRTHHIGEVKYEQDSVKGYSYIYFSDFGVFCESVLVTIMQNDHR
jgi:hypothetical protein